MIASRSVVESVVARGETAYGINTGFGKLSDVRIGREDLQQLQRNLVRSHACGLGEPLEEAEVRAMLLLRANVLTKGFSGVRYQLIELLIGLLNAPRTSRSFPAEARWARAEIWLPWRIWPWSLIGEGEVFFHGRADAGPAGAGESWSHARWCSKPRRAWRCSTEPRPWPRWAVWRVLRAVRVNRLFDLAGAMALEALRGTPVAFDERIHQARPHPGQMQAAAHLRALLRDSEIRESHRHNDPRVQDAYCLRCMPQVHGAARGALSMCAK